MENCSTCGGAADRPYRRTSAGGYQEGCVDTFHNEAMAWDAWHNRKDAKAIRKSSAVYWGEKAR